MNHRNPGRRAKPASDTSSAWYSTASAGRSLNYVTANLHVRAGLTADGVRWALQSTEGANWFPLTWVSHMLDVQLFGMSSGFHHLTSVLLHALSAVLL